MSPPVISESEATVTATLHLLDDCIDKINQLSMKLCEVKPEGIQPVMVRSELETISHFIQTIRVILKNGTAGTTN
jgi:hypothetical protein